MKTNVPRQSIHTHEGGKAKHINSEQELRRSVMACLLWEDGFYEDGVSIANRISGLVPEVDPEKVALMAIEAREKMKLRHVPLLLVREMARHKTHKYLASETLSRVIQRADELTELLSLYWIGGKCPVSAQIKKGLAKAYLKFNEYALSKYNRDNVVKLRDVMFLTHPKPKDKEQEGVWKKLVDGTLEPAITWEYILSKKDGLSKKDKWERVIDMWLEGGKVRNHMAILRNLRNITEAGVSDTYVNKLINCFNHPSWRNSRVLPFRFIAAARYAVNYEQYLEAAMLGSLQEREKFSGHTVLLVDVSGSMNSPISAKSDISRMDAGCGLAMLLREVCERIDIFTFSNKFIQVPARRGFALRDAIVNSQPHSSTPLGLAVKAVYYKAVYSSLSQNVGDRWNKVFYKGQGLSPDRLVVITDEQSNDGVPDPVVGEGYMINVAMYQNGVGYGKWLHIDGFSEAIVDYLQEYEKME